MNLALKKESMGIWPICTAALLALVGGFFCAFFAQLGMLLLPMAAAPLAVAFMLERGRKRVFTVILPVAIVALDIVFNGVYSFACLGAVIVAAMIYITLETGFFTKGESALAAVLLLSVLVFLTFILYGCIQIDKFDLSGALGYYRELVTDTESKWVSALETYMLQYGAEDSAQLINEDLLVDLYYNYVHSIYSMIMIVLIILVGLSYKLFVAAFAKHVERKSVLYAWRFTLTPMYGYVYLAVWLIGRFATDYSGFSIVVGNISNVLSFLLAYMGFLFLDAYLRMKSDGRSGAKLLVLLSLLLFGGIALTALSFVGVVASVVINKFNDQAYSDNQENGKKGGKL